MQHNLMNIRALHENPAANCSRVLRYVPVNQGVALLPDFILTTESIHDTADKAKVAVCCYSCR